MHSIAAMIIADRLAREEYRFMRKLGYSAREALAHAFVIEADFWMIYRCDR